MRRTPLVVLLALALAGPLLADPGDALVAALAAARGAGSPLHAFLGALADLPDATLDGAALRGALRRGGLPSHPAGDAVLEAVTRLERRGDRLTLTLARPTSVEVVVGGEPRGWVHLAGVVRLRVRRTPDGATLDDIGGLRLSRKERSFAVSLKRLAATREAGRPVARVTAGLTWPLEKTVSIDLADPLRSTRGLVGSVADADAR